MRLDPDEKSNLNERGYILLNSTLTLPKTVIELPTKSYVDSVHEINRNRRDLSSVFNDRDTEFDNNKLTNLGSITVNRDHLDVRKYHVDVDGIRYLKDSVFVDYGLNYYVDQYRDLKLIYREYVAEELLTVFISFSDLKNKYRFQLIDLIFQVDHINPEKTGISEEHSGETNNARLFILLIRHREVKMISDGNEITEVSVF